MKMYSFILFFLLTSIMLYGQSGGEEDCGTSCHCLFEKANNSKANLDLANAMQLYQTAKKCYQTTGKQDSAVIVDDHIRYLFEEINELKAKAEQNRAVAEQSKVKKSTETGLLSTLSKSGATYYDFGKEKKKDEYLVYPPSPNDIFIGFGVVNRIQLKAFPYILPNDVVSTSLEVVDSDALLPITLGYWYQRTENGFFSVQLQFQQQQLLETIEAEALISQEQYQIRRFMDMDATVLVAGVGKSFNNLHIYVGLESTYLRTQYQPISTFIFNDQEALGTVLPDAPVSDLSDNQIEVEQEQLRDGVNYLNLSAFWQISYRLSLGDNFFFGLQANNIIPVNTSLLNRLSDSPFSTASLWEDLYAIDYDAIRVKSISYLQLQLGYHFNREKRIKSYLQLY